MNRDGDLWPGAACPIIFQKTTKLLKLEKGNNAKVAKSFLKTEFIKQKNSFSSFSFSEVRMKYSINHKLQYSYHYYYCYSYYYFYPYYYYYLYHYYHYYYFYHNYCYRHLYSCSYYYYYYYLYYYS